MKKCLSLMLSLLLLSALAVPALAEENLPAPITESTPAETTPPVTNPPETTPPATNPPETKPAETTPPETNPPATDPSTPTQPHTHSYGNWIATADKHSRICSCGHKEEAAHTLVEVIVEPTCTEPGGTAKVCVVCEHIAEVKVSAVLAPHTYDNDCDPDCNVCKAIREVTHTYATTWSKNASGHWYACTKCGAKKEVLKHYPGPAATEEKEQICLTCGYVMMPKKNHVHNYSTTWSSDEAGHWYSCSGCSAEDKYAAHVYDNACDPECNVCGYKNEKAHSYDTQWQSDEHTHWNTCSVCKETTEPEAHIPGPEPTDEEPQICTVCGYELSPMLEHTHDFENNWEYGQDNHWQKCKCGELTVPKPHTWDEGEEIQKGTLTYTCLECGAEKTEDAPSGFPWWIVFTLLGVLIVGGVVALVIMMRPRKPAGKFSKK